MQRSPASIRHARVALAIAFFLAGGTYAQASGVSSIETKNMHIESRKLLLNENTGVFSMPYHVKYTRPGTDLVGDRAQGNEKSEQITVSGNVVLHNNGGFQPGTIPQASVGNEPQTLTCDELAVDAKAKNYVATGNMHFTQGARTATATRAQLNESAHLLTLDGAVQIGDGKQTFRGDHMTYDTLTGEVHATGGPGILDAPGMHVETQEYQYNQTSGDFSMPGHVKFTRDGTDAVGDRAQGNTQAQTVTIVGNVVVHNTGGYTPPAASTAKKTGADPQTLTSDKLEIDSLTKHYIASGHMHFAQGARKASADTGDLDDGKHLLVLLGDVRIDSGRNTFRGDKVTYDTEAGSFEAEGAPGTLTAPVATANPRPAKTPKPGKNAKKGGSPSPVPSLTPTP